MCGANAVSYTHLDVYKRQLINSGTDILSISKRLGHANTSTTLNFYGHILQKADAQSAECIANVLLRKNPFPPQEPHDNV